MANIKITDLDAYADPKSTDVLPAVDVTNDETKKVSIADLMENAGSGTEAAPGIAFDGDPNTGIYRPGADQVAISTGGTGRLFVDASGNVLLSSTTSLVSTNSTDGSDSKRLILTGGGAIGVDRGAYINLQGNEYSGGGNAQVVAGNNGYIVFNTGSGNERLRITSDGKVGVGTSSPTGLLTVAADFPVIDWAYAANTAFKHTIEATGYATSPVSGNNLAIKVASGSGTQATVMHLNGAGQVGIGTTSPSEQLEIYSTSDHRLKVSRAATAIELFQPASASPMLNASGTGVALRFGINDTEAARITSDGKVGLGTSSPSDLLHIKSTAAQLKIESSSGVNNCILHRNGATDAWRVGMNLTLSNGSYEIYDDVNNVDRLVIDSSGRVGIGITSPNAALDVATAVRVNSTGTVTSGFADALNMGTWDALGYDNYDIALGGYRSGQYQAIRFYGSGSERARIDSSGRLLVGTSTVQAVNGGDLTYLQIQGTSSGAASQSIIRHTNDSGGPWINLGKSRATSAGGVTVVQSGDTLGSISFFGADGNDINTSAALIRCQVDGTPGSNDMPGRLVFSTTADGAASPTERMRIDSSGRVGIGTTSPEEFLQIDGGRLKINTTSASRAITLNAPTDGCYVTFETAGTPFADIGAAKGTLGAGSVDDLVINLRGSREFLVRTNSNERMRIDSSGRLGLGTTSPGHQLSVVKATGGDVISFTNGAASNKTGYLYSDNQFVGLMSIGGAGNDQGILFDLTNAKTLIQRIGGTTATFDSSGRVGIGTTSPTAALNVSTGGTDLVADFVGTSSPYIRIDNGTKRYVAQVTGSDFRIQDQTASAERLRIDSSGRLLVGTSTSRVAGYGISPNLQVEGLTSGASIGVVRNSADVGGGYVLLGKSRGTSLGSFTAVQSGDTVGGIYAQGADGTALIPVGAIEFQVDGTPGANDMPGRLVFSTTADGASSPTERMRITNSGAILIGKASDTFATIGARISASGVMTLTADGNELANFNRLTDDGALLYFSQASAIEGSITVSGTTVSYNGAHLSRWSQLPGGATREEILRGTVLSNIDEMCDWGEEENEQLNRMKVSDVEGDRNVSGVFQAWDDDDDTYTNDFYCAMTGDFVIRIAQGVTVERGDLLMSAGDGTAKPQDDDIIRSKTIAKVTSTHVSETYADGSYCVPCVLMAC